MRLGMRAIVRNLAMRKIDAELGTNTSLALVVDRHDVLGLFPPAPRMDQRKAYQGQGQGRS